MKYTRSQYHIVILLVLSAAYAAASKFNDLTVLVAVLWTMAFFLTLHIDERIKNRGLTHSDCNKLEMRQTKVTRWVNIYNEATLYSSEEEAKKNAASQAATQAKVEWEE